MYFSQSCLRDVGHAWACQEKKKVLARLVGDFGLQNLQGLDNLASLKWFCYLRKMYLANFGEIPRSVPNYLVMACLCSCVLLYYHRINLLLLCSA